MTKSAKFRKAMTTHAKAVRHRRCRGRKWRRTRQEFFDADPLNGLCRHCLKDGKTVQAVIVDHIVPVAVDPSREFDLDNLQGLCVHHDRIKTASDGSQQR